MATGMEMLVASILKASGVDAEKVKADIANYGRQLGEKIASMDQSLAAIKHDQAQVFDAVLQLSDRLAERLGGLRAAETESPPASRPVNGEAKHGR